MIRRCYKVLISIAFFWRIGMVYGKTLVSIPQTTKNRIISPMQTLFHLFADSLRTKNANAKPEKACIPIIQRARIYSRSSQASRRPILLFSKLATGKATQISFESMRKRRNRYQERLEKKDIQQKGSDLIEWISSKEIMRVRQTLKESTATDPITQAQKPIFSAPLSSTPKPNTAIPQEPILSYSNHPDAAAFTPTPHIQCPNYNPHFLTHPIGITFIVVLIVILFSLCMTFLHSCIKYKKLYENVVLSNVKGRLSLSDESMQAVSDAQLTSIDDTSASCDSDIDFHQFVNF